MGTKRTLSFALVCSVGLTSTTAAIAQTSFNRTFDKEAAAHAWWDLYFKDSRSVKLADGRTINLLCVGQGSPVVVLDAGMGNGAWTWRHVHAELARSTRVCAYDRSGYGQSSRSTGERTAATEADELAQLLERAPLPAPYILVGRSYAAFIDRLYAHRHLNQVAALVLVDPSTEYQFTRYASVHPEAAKNDAAALIHARECLKSAQAGTLSDQCQVQPPGDLPASRADWWRQQAPALAEAILLEYLDMNTISSDQLSAERSLGSLPLLLLGRDLAEDIWRKMLDETLNISSSSKLEIVAGAGHQIQEDQPMAFVEAVNGVVAQVRAGNK
ncbi:alpha/beta fold hydrolase [Bradyrhizobium sp. CCGUVB14]|uniref:alpha/beta fold hydrolase n=1 Tax=Bradyrhizobium sp. CCGUVB14 TaxID=2949628 RepID=UPI0020B2BED8|nr:alpha/beta hydrolase [Bradyrhizobium sp. CCGUVB14]MCP3443176.1 alpha/beta hydrolase [Bradyrhizobium sp. CCGUVB14]